jgi:hypothetical protein
VFGFVDVYFYIVSIELKGMELLLDGQVYLRISAAERDQEGKT